MTNTLTWDIKPIQLPKINANLLSVVSMILLLTTVFMMVHPALASHCEELAWKAGVWAAASIIAASLAKLAVEGLKAAIASLNPGAIIAASAAVLLTAAAAVYAARKAAEYATELYECVQSHASASGGCNSGGCGSG